MAIAFARLEFVKRSEGKNACAKSAYLSRKSVSFHGNKFQEVRIFDWSKSYEGPPYDEILLPENANAKFKDPEILWNLAESKELRKDSQVAMEVVLALPDDAMITVEDRVELSKLFAKEHFVAKGLGVQVVVHSPEKTKNGDHNWHVHFLITTRRFKETGEDLEDTKARDLMPSVRGGRVTEAEVWWKPWAKLQNSYFEKKGIPLRVDPIGVVPQKHLGPKRLRGKAYSLLVENDCLIDLNKVECADPRKVLDKIVETKSVFTVEDVDRFLNKHLDAEKVSEVREAFWKQSEVIELLDRKQGEKTALFTTKAVHEEEGKIVRLADRIYEKQAFKLKGKLDYKKHISNLTEEQSAAFKNVIGGRKLSCVEGHAGTGKSHLLVALKNYYESQGFIVRGFGPDNATAKVLQEKGFSNAENNWKFLFSNYYQTKQVRKGKEVWVVDEAGKFGNRLLLEFLKEAEKNKVQLVLSGCSSQISSVERGGMFEVFCERYGSETLIDIQRQKDEAHRSMAKSIAVGDVSQAINKLYSFGGIHWSSDRKEAMEELIEQWSNDRDAFPISSCLIVVRSNKDLRVLNELARAVRKERGEITETEYQCETSYGKVYISEGDRVEFRKNDRELGVTNGLSGTLVKASNNEFVVLVDGDKREVKFDPRYYHSYQLGYASTNYRSQGRTVDRAYVLHSPGMNKREFYVGITRHIQDVHFFVSREESKSLSHLKWYLDQDEKVQSTIRFTTQDEIEHQKSLDASEKKIQELKASDKVLDRFGGHGLSLFRSVKQKAGNYFAYKKDIKSDKQFYRPEIDQSRQKMEVSLVEADDFSSEISEVRQSTNLSKEQKKALESYFVSCDKASLLKDIVVCESQNLEREERSAPHFWDWQKACGFRNQQAHQLLQVVSKEELAITLGEKSTERVVEIAKRYEESLERREEHNLQDDTVSDQELKDLTITLEAWQSGKGTQLKEALNEYLDSKANADLIKSLAGKESEILERELKEVPHFRDWQVFCGERNQKAYEFLQIFSKEDIRFYLGDGFFDVLSQKSDRHQKGSVEATVVDRHELEKVETRKGAWEKLSDHDKECFNSYLKHEATASSFASLVFAQAEALGLDAKDVPQYREWQKVCGLRNQSAFSVEKNISAETLSFCLSPRHLENIQKKAERFQASRQESDNLPIDHAEQIEKIKSSKDFFKGLPKEKLKLLKTYLECSKKTNQLLGLMKKESEVVQLSWRAAPHFGAWKESCKQRNQLANEIESTFSKSDQALLFGERHCDLLQERAQTAREESKQKKSNFHGQEEVSLNSISLSLEKWSSLTESQKGSLNNYLRAREISAKNMHILKLQEKILEREWSDTPAYKAWRSAFYDRNARAVDLTKALSDPELDRCLGDRHANFVRKQVDQYGNTAHSSSRENPITVDPEICRNHEEKINKLVEIRETWKSLTNSQVKILRSYLKVKDRIGSIERNIDIDSNLTDAEIRNTKVYSRWQEAVVERKNIVEELKSSLTQKQLEICLGEDFSNQSEKADDENHLFQRKNSFSNLSPEKQSAVIAYRQSTQNVAVSREIVSAESERLGKNFEQVKQFKAFQVACGERNKQAYELKNRLTAEELSSIFNSGTTSINDQANRYEEFLAKSNEKHVSYEELERGLRDNVEKLLFRLVPDGPTRKERHKLRFGRKGSLCVNISGPKAGSFYDFENQEGGGLIKLIEKTQGLSKQDAEKWAKDFLNVSQSIEVPKSYQTSKGAGSQKESNWVAVKPNSEPPELPKIGSGKFYQQYKETARYAYRDIDGKPLFFTLRLVDKNDPSNKVVLPLSYGHWKGHPGRCYWNLKHYSNSNRPLYNQHVLKERSEAPVLIVEGEKSADAASQKCKDFVCISWSGGSGAVQKTDWSPLKGKDIVIWPDNDKAGFKAANEISSQLRKQGVDRLRVVKQEHLSQDFPEKWDLADPLPNGKSDQDIKDMILSSKEQGINPREVVFHIPGMDSKNPIHLARANEVLYRVDERLRIQLEEQLGTQGVREGIVNEAVKILSDEKNLKEKIQKEFGVEGELLSRLSYQAMLFSAQHGKAPSSVYIESLKGKIRESTWIQEFDQQVRKVTLSIILHTSSL